MITGQSLAIIATARTPVDLTLPAHGSSD